MIESLEHRVIFDIAVIGGEGHVKIAVDWRHGLVSAEFHASGYCGHTGPQPSGVALMIGTQGYIHQVYQPGKSVAENTGTAAFRFKTIEAADERVMWEMARSGGELVPLILPWLAFDNYYEGQGAFSTYNVNSWNCFSFANRMVEAAFGDFMPDTDRWKPLEWHLTNLRKALLLPLPQSHRPLVSSPFLTELLT